MQGYIADKETKSEQIEALIYVADDVFQRLGIKREESPFDRRVYDVVTKIVTEVNKTEQPYARISKITLLEKPLEMTTTQKVKRVYKK